VSPPVRFGLFVPQGDVPPPTLRAIAQTAERAGLHSLWAYDHLDDYPSPEQPDVLEVFTLLGLLAGWTERIRLGSLVLCDGYRNPALTAKMAATLDVLSGGRLELGYGAGWHESETRAYGYPFPPASTRIARMEEGLAIIRGLWSGEPTTFAGAHYRVEAAKCRPCPLQQPHPPITIGGGGEKLLLRAVARHADIWNYFPIPLPAYEHKRAVLHAHCAAIHRDPATLDQSLMVPLVTARREKEVRDQLEAARQRGGTFAYDDQLVQGTPDIVVPRLLDYVRRGVTLFILVLPDPTDLAQIEFVAREVVAELV
jgi:F420-dependent oxidoreductase-like protein